MQKLVKSKPVGNKYLNLSSGISDHDFPGEEVYHLSLGSRAAPWPESGTGEAFLTAPDAYVLSLAVYNVIFDSIKSEDDFRKIRSEFEGPAFALYNAVRKHK